MKSSVKKALTFISLSIMLTSLYKYEKMNKTTYNIQHKKEDYYSVYIYNKGKVYIGKKEDLIKILDMIKPNDVIVLDQRDNLKDPNMKIIQSYRIKDANTRNEILRILHLYEKQNPSRWNRTIPSMRREWLVHNLLHSLNIEPKRTKDVDFNNNDETTYRK